MAYFNEIVDLYKETKRDYYQITIRNNFIIIEGKVEIVVFDDKQFSIKTKTKRILIIGNNIQVIKSIKGEIVLKGQFKNIEVEDNVN